MGFASMVLPNLVLVLPAQICACVLVNDEVCKKYNIRHYISVSLLSMEGKYEKQV